MDLKTSDMKGTAGGYKRRGAIAIKLAIMLPVIGGFAAVGVDLTYLHSMQADLSRAADACALAAASRLAQAGSDDLHAAVLAEAQVAANHNPIGAEVVLLGPEDLILGQATFDANATRFTWAGPTDTAPNAVQVTLRRTEGSPSGPLPLYFGRLIGRSSANLWATARAVLIPRDIALVCDLSGSMNDDSELRHYASANINLRDIWLALGGGNGPTFGMMTTWGTHPITANYDPTADAGLLQLPRNGTWSSAANALITAQGYNSAELYALQRTRAGPGGTPSAFDDNTNNNWRNRTAVTLGLANWRSGKAGARHPGGGDGDDRIEDNELVWANWPWEGGSDQWKEYIVYVGSTSGSAMYAANTAFRYRYGLKTLVNFLLEKRSAHSATSALWQTPELPLKAVKDAVGEIVTILATVDSGDQLSLEVYATTGRHEVNLTRDFVQTQQVLIERQSNHYDNTTCIGCGLTMARQELSSERARDSAAKVILLLTDGIANINEDGDYCGDGCGNSFALSEASLAAAQNMTIYAIGVGAEADMNLMNSVAEVGRGSAFWATGSVEEYSEQLLEIFRTLGGKRSAILIR